ncbi:hypothetical protein [Desulforamulus putei]|uniref:hypothetical protein n=1 Tax=Desulforamulus putei TaxID=74701 RepID=UPI002FDE7501
MNARTFAAFLVHSQGQIKGKKAFQKLVYLAKAIGIPLNHSYKMHYYGPYSDSVAEEFEKVYLEDVIDKSKDADYIYIPGTKVEKALIDGQLEIQQNKELLDTLMRLFGNMSPRFLEIYCTAHFVWKMHVIFNWPTDRSSILEGIKKVKFPKFDEPTIEKAYDDLVSWGLIRGN